MTAEAEEPPPKRTIRRIQKATEPEAAAPVMDEEPPEPVAESVKAAKSNTRRAVPIQRTFFAALLTGTLFALVDFLNLPALNWVSFVGPVAAVLAFFLFGNISGWSRLADSRQRFADACYFLGFLFTMIALMVGFIPAGLGLRELTSQEILRHFGMALGATAAGLIGRILVLQSASPSEVAAEVEADLTQMAGKLADETKRIVADVAQIRSSISEPYRQAADAVTSELTRGVKDIVTSFSTSVATIQTLLEAQAAGVQSATSGLLTTISNRNAELEKIAAAAVAAHTAAATAASEVAQSLNTFNESLSTISADSRRALIEAAANIQSVSRSLATLATGQQRISGIVDDVNRQADEATASVSALRLSVDQGRASVQAWSQEAAQLGPQILRSVSENQAAAVQVISDSSTALSSELDQATVQLAKVIDRFGRQLNELRSEPVSTDKGRS